MKANKGIALPLAATLLAVLSAACGSASRRAPPAVAAPAPLSDALEPDAILRAMTVTADWQLANPSRWPTYTWHQAAFWAGMTAFAPLVPDRKYHEAIRKNGQANDWKPAPRPFHADDHAISQSYLWLYMQERDRRMIEPTLARFEEVMAKPYDESLEWKDKLVDREWAWCDALFMSPPALAMASTATGDPKYLTFMSRLWWKTTDYLYDKEERLYYRDSRFFDKRQPNGKKTFWSRGNGWVLAGLVRVLQHLPEQHPERPRFLALYAEMAPKIASLQTPAGYWPSSLLDAGSLPSPESSGTGFFTYALAWGINQGLLDRATYEPVVRKGWSALVRSVQPSGMVGYVQKVGDSPGDTAADKTEIYGVGAFLLAGSELHRMVLLSDAKPVGRLLDTPSNGPGPVRPDELVELPLTADETRAVAAGQVQLVAVDGRTGAFLPSQLHASKDDGASDRLLVLVTMTAGEKRAVRVYAVPRARRLPPTPVRAYARYVPERKDDFAWENDRIGFRVYGAALAAAGEISSGIDVWAKKVRHPVIDGWYARGDYHDDRGEGLDFYKVGPSRGCGGVGLRRNDKLHVSGNYRAWTQRAAGPLRVVFELTYDAWGAEGMKVTETKRVSLDAGSNLSRIELRFAPVAKAGPLPAKLPIAVGIQRRGEGAAGGAADGSWASFWEPPQGDDGQIGCGIVMPAPGAEVVEGAGHTLLVTQHPSNQPFVYFAGAAWSKGLDFPTAEAWDAYLAGFVRARRAPIAVALAR